MLIALLILVHDRQKHETASDLRAVALTGNPEALVRALVKLHAIARVPRRWDADLERHMSHPSLKKRIQDIRAAAGTAPAALGASSVLESADGAARVVFHEDSLEWIEGASASYRLRYDRLSELRIEARPTGETSLLAADRAGHRWQMPLRVDDVPRIQAVLDIVDARVETSAPATSVQPMLTHAVTFIVCIVSLNAGLLAVAMVVAMNFARPVAPLLCAAGLAAMAGAVLTWRDPASMYGYLPDAYEWSSPPFCSPGERCSSGWRTRAGATRFHCGRGSSSASSLSLHSRPGWCRLWGEASTLSVFTRPRASGRRPCCFRWRSRAR